jgi:aconitase A
VNILAYTQTGFYLEENHLRLEDFDRYEKRCENAEVMKREIFSTSLIQNKIIYPKPKNKNAK